MALEKPNLGEWNLYDDVKCRHIVVSLKIDKVTYEEVTGDGGRKSKSSQTGPRREARVPSPSLRQTVVGQSRGDWVGLVERAVTVGMIDACDAFRMYGVEVPS